MDDAIGLQQFHQTAGVEDWRIVGDGATAFFRTVSFSDGARLVHAITALPDIDEHSPDIDLRPDGVTVRLLTLTDSYCGITTRDVELARRISVAAHELELPADPSAVQSVLVVPGAPATAGIMPFWQAILGYERRPDSPDEDLIDPRGRGPAFWFENMEEPRSGGQGAVHIAVWVPHDHAEARVAAALAAGGRIVRENFAPAWWTLADSAGNEADVSTTLARG